MDKEEISEILDVKFELLTTIQGSCDDVDIIEKDREKLLNQTTEELTALIIKWLESKRKQVRYENVKREMGLDGVIIEREKHITYNKEEEACNQLITELKGELR